MTPENKIGKQIGPSCSGGDCPWKLQERLQFPVTQQGTGMECRQGQGYLAVLAPMTNLTSSCLVFIQSFQSDFPTHLLPKKPPKNVMFAEKMNS